MTFAKVAAPDYNVSEFEFVYADPKDPNQDENDARICSICRRYFCMGFDGITSYCSECHYEAPTAAPRCCAKKYPTVFSPIPKPIIIEAICRDCAAEKRIAIFKKNVQKNIKHNRPVPLKAKERRLRKREQKRRHQIAQAKSNLIFFPEEEVRQRKMSKSKRRAKPGWVGKKGHFVRDVCQSYRQAPSQCVYG